MAIQFKFREDTAPVRRAEIAGAVTATPGSPTVRPLFPDEQDAELASLYRVEGLPQDLEAEVIALLSDSSEVEFAEPDVRRKLIR